LRRQSGKERGEGEGEGEEEEEGRSGEAIWGRLFPALAPINCLHKSSPKLWANERAAIMKLETAEGFGQVIAAHSLMFLTAVVGPIQQ
jgi:hypothetical protein